MAHADPDMTKANEKGRPQKILRIDMTLPFNVPGLGGGVWEQQTIYRVSCRPEPQEILPENSLTRKRRAAQLSDLMEFLERETRLELATSTLARLRSTN